MKKFTLIIALLALMFAGCSKDGDFKMSKSECKDRQEALIENADRGIKSVIGRYNSGDINDQEFIDQYNAVIDQVNKDAFELTDCCCWSNLPHMH
jgi:PBP1b-binding outer membrane lipoprotein LpoB